MIPAIRLTERIVGLTTLYAICVMKVRHRRFTAPNLLHLFRALKEGLTSFNRGNYVQIQDHSIPPDPKHILEFQVQCYKRTVGS
ncbi:hypothetical protein GALMADRAFT_251816 [Galerina marginata CBS 339.88]|uniref:Uncharacterized protein n=1 Tax=Galerina marginata (strain CBS 339.88) TaxID=685588 RepID=A0A067T2H7_GALM3|nr:hypothetical protein GALMADRAFT_251816 [Galerina marginata CBS 339.88]